MKVNLFDESVFGTYGLGVHRHIPDEIYHNDIKAVSSSSMREWRKSPRHFRYFFENEEEYEQTSQMFFGSMAHLCLFQKDVFDRTVIVSEAKDRRAKAYKELAETAPDKHIMLQSEFDKLTAMMQELLQTRHCMRLIANGLPEVSIFAKDPATGLMLKGRMDWISEDRPMIVDYKTSTDVKPDPPENEDQYVEYSAWTKHASNLGYENQAAFYLKLCKLAGVRADSYCVVAQETKPPYLCQSYFYGFETIEYCMKENETTLTEIAESCAKDEFKGYSDKIEVLRRPHWKMKGV